MNYFLIAALLIGFHIQAQAGGPHKHSQTSATYYIGQQAIGIAGDTQNCFVEAQFSSNGSAVKIRALVADPHDAELVGFGVIQANYDAAKAVYFMNAKSKKAIVQQMLLKSQTLKSAESMDLTLFDNGHYDSLSCQQLKEANSTELKKVMEMFEHFYDFVEDHHNHNHNQNHGNHQQNGHKHKH